MKRFKQNCSVKKIALHCLRFGKVNSANSVAMTESISGCQFASAVNWNRFLCKRLWYEIYVIEGGEGWGGEGEEKKDKQTQLEPITVSGFK